MATGKYQKWIEPDGLTLIRGWARDGLTDEQLARNMGISTKTLYEWKKTHCEIREALKSGKDVADYEVENALFEMAKSGNVTAAIFWLKNRKPGKWRSKPENESDGKELEKLRDILGGIPSAF